MQFHTKVLILSLVWGSQVRACGGRVNTEPNAVHADRVPSATSASLTCAGQQSGRGRKRSEACNVHGKAHRDGFKLQRIHAGRKDSWQASIPSSWHLKEEECTVLCILGFSLVCDFHCQMVNATKQRNGAVGKGRLYGWKGERRS